MINREGRVRNDEDAGGEILRAIVRNMSPSVKAQQFGELSATLMWTLNERASRSLVGTLQSWLEGSDERLATLAIWHEDVYFNDSPEEMEQAFEKLIARFPALRPRAYELTTRWREERAKKVE